MIRLPVVVLVLALSFIASCTRIANATEWWDWDGYHSGPNGHYRHHRRTVPRRDYDREVRLYRTPERDDDHRGFACGDRVRGLGTQWIGTEGALDAARKDWMERVRYDHGEKWIDMSNATDFESRCGRVSIGEALGQVTYRCEIVARPCLAEFQEGEGKQK